MLEQLLQWDTELFIGLNNLGNPSWDTFWVILTNKLTFVPLYLFLLFLVYKKIGLNNMFIALLVIILMITFTDQMTNLAKRSFARARPCRNNDIIDSLRMVVDYCGKYGFFSGHSSNSMAGAIFGGFLLKPYFNHVIKILIVWSFFVAYSRIYVGVHYPLDVFCGLSFGAISGYIFYKIFKYFSVKSVIDKPI